jgi:GTP-binding protein Era
MAEKYRAGFASLAGRPNAGKSTLLNALVGGKVAIVSAKPQTTRTIVQGVWTGEEAQIVFLDMPGIHAGKGLLGRRMMESVRTALDGRDLLLYVADATRPVGREDERAVEMVARGGAPLFLVLNKIDRLEDKRLLLPLIERYGKMAEFAESVPVSAKTGEGLEELLQLAAARMPEGPAMFPEDYLTDQPERFLAAEFLREQVLEATRQEVPHAVAVRIEAWQDEGRLARIAAVVVVERAGQKAILIGAKGAMLKRIATRARLAIEEMLGRKVFLEVFVKVEPGWRENPRLVESVDWRGGGVVASGDGFRGESETS